MDNNSGSLQQLSAKKRSYEDLSRFIGAKTSGAPNYTLLMGAGCSVSSGVRSGGQLVEQWRRELFQRLAPEEEYSPGLAKEFFTKKHAVWYNPLREYSSLFEKNFDLPRQRRMFVEQEVAAKSPNLGYAYLIRLIEEGFLNTIFTTNFDDLINESFFQFSRIRPVVCAHDSSVGSITVTSKRPKVIKLHGDYLFDDIKSTVRETESLEENTRKKLIEFGRDFGLVVAGYSGCDRSVMDVLQYLLRSDDYFKHGVYWCLRAGEEPSDELLKLLWRDRVYYVEVDGFDELMASLHNDLIGDSLPIDTSVITDKPKQIVSGFCESSYLNDSPSKLIRRDLDKLKKLDDREQLFSVIRNLKSQAPDKENRGDALTDKELGITIEVKRLIYSSEFPAARTRVASELNQKPSIKFRNELLDLRVKIEEVAADIPAAIAAIEAMIEDDPREVDHYLRKTYFVHNHDKRLQILVDAQSIDKFDYRIYDRRFDCLVEAHGSGVGLESDALLREIEENVEASLKCDPGIRNPTWYGAAEFYAKTHISNESFKSKLDGLIEKLSAMDPSRITTLRTRLLRLSRTEEDRKSPEADTLLADISRYKLERASYDKKDYEWLELDAYSELDRKNELSRRISELEIIDEVSRTKEYLVRKAEFLIKFSGDLGGAVEALRQGVAAHPSRGDILRLASLLEYKKDADAIRNIGEQYAKQLTALDRLLVKRSECEASGDVAGALSQLRATYGHRIVGVAERILEVHDLILTSRFEEASSIAKATLESVKWNKYEFAELIVNFELAELRAGRQVNKRRLSEIVESSRSEYAKGCANYLLGNSDKAKAIFVKEIRRDREMMFCVKGWAIFSDEPGKRFLETLEKSIS